MIKEFAVEPEAIANSYRDFFYIIEKFGLPQGRVIAEFPRKWKAMVFQAAQAKLTGTRKLTDITECLKQLPNDILFRSPKGRGDGNASWLERVAAVQASQPFDFVLTANSLNAPQTVRLEDFTEKHECLTQNRHWRLSRTAHNISAACAFHWQTAKHVKLIDPYFDLGEPRYQRPFERLFAMPTQVQQLDIYRNDNFGAASIPNRWQDALGHAMAQGVRVRVFFRSVSDMHNRYFLTDLGALTFGAGLCEDAKNPPAIDDILLLERDTRLAHWNAHDDANPVFDSQTP